MKRPIDLTALGLMILLCLTWGLQQTAMKLAAPGIDPMLQIGLRSAIAAALVFAISRLVRRDRWLPRIFAGPGLLAGTLFALEFLLVAEGLRWTTASHIGVFLYTGPIFAAMGLHFAQPDERMARVQWLGVAITFTGVAAIFLLPELRGNQPLAPSMIVGDLLGLGAGIAWGLTTVVIRTSRLANAPPAQTLTNQLFVAGIVALAFSALTGRLGMQPRAVDLVNLGFQTIIICTVSFMIWFRLLQVYPSSRLGVLSLMTPVFGVMSGALLLGEHLTPDFLFGGAFVLLGMLTVQAHDLLARRRGLSQGHA
ncbi:DMT family transporter [Paracoccus sp. IB05]|uniref:DMT family transporter n=1 Tax=Paracoccus sp. IB05 TaxID=2779367 RepID=UPI0018E6FAD3|nr:DMT family transporter [Paracoccus sp. IB05]MBJ2151654.1 DMT family transporter [Paracoccus sp. IB05]